MRWIPAENRCFKARSRTKTLKIQSASPLPTGYAGFLGRQIPTSRGHEIDAAALKLRGHPELAGAMSDPAGELPVKSAQGVVGQAVFLEVYGVVLP